ncbi:hypothetical protein [Mesorhizobium sp. M1272]|uniref:hypothetical protein n=1 Tax=Mesorhizobium sp. M1272 TaxID=2957074 RepID=UPI00333DE46D
MSAVIVGFILVLAGIGVLGVQTYWYLQSGMWTPLSLIDVGQMYLTAEKAPWVFFPQSWLGVYKILAWIPSSGLLFAFGILIINGADS